MARLLALFGSIALSACGRTEPLLGSHDLPADAGLASADAGPDCQPSLQITSLTRLPTDDPFAIAIPGRGTVTYQEMTGDFGRIERLDLQTKRQTRLTEGAVRLIDATRSRTLFAVDQNGQNSVWLEDEGLVKDLMVEAPRYFGHGAEPRRQLSGPLAAFCGGAGASIHALDLETGDRFESLAQEGIPCAEPLFVQGRNVLHLGPPRDSLNAIMRFQADFGAPLPTAMVWGANLAMPVLFQNQIYYLSDGLLSSRELSYGSEVPERTLTTSGCTAVHASSSGVVAACGTEGAAWVYTPATELWFHDGQTLRRLPAADQDGRAILLPRIGDGFVTWLAYDDPEDLCQGEFGRPAGHVMVAALPDGPPVRVAPINAGCFCCGARWPDPMLEARDDTIVWNYDASAGEIAPRESSFGAARIVVACAAE